MEKENLFRDIRKKIENHDFEKALKKLNKILESNEASENKAYANFLIGYIHSNDFFLNRDVELGKKALIKCIESEYPRAQAFTLLALIEEDRNIANNCLKKGKSLFPNSPIIYKGLLDCSLSRDDNLLYIKEIKELEIKDSFLLNQVLEFLISQYLWEDARYFVGILLKNENLSKSHKLIYKLIEAFSLALSNDEKNIKCAENMLIILISEDIANELCYAHYMGIILCYIKQNNKKGIAYYIENFSIKEKFVDFGFWTGSPIVINFIKEYSMIFSEIIKLFQHDKTITTKIRAIRASYLLYPSIEYGIRGNNNHITDLKRQLREEPNNINIIQIILKAQFHLNLNFDAYKTYLNIPSYDMDNITTERKNIINHASNSDFEKIYSNLLKYLKNKNYLDKYFISEIFDNVITRLWEKGKENKYEKIVSLSNLIARDDKIVSSKLFELAYSYGECNLNNEAQNIYSFILENNPNNSAVLNNLGVLYRKNNQHYTAYEFFQKAHKIDSQEELYLRNLRETEKVIENTVKDAKKQEDDQIKKIAKNLNLEYFNSIGYDENLKSSFDRIDDEKLKDILLKDLKECVVCLATKQNKCFAIMCGSIIEAILYWSLARHNIKKYEIKNKTKHLNEMGINDLLHVANQENLIQTNTFHFCHGLKDYRNIVHPSRDLSSDFERTNEEATIIWGLLKKIIKDILR